MLTNHEYQVTDMETNYTTAKATGFNKNNYLMFKKTTT